MENLDLNRYYPLIIIFVGGLIAFLVVVYYATKSFARAQGIIEASNDIPLDPHEIYHSYNIILKNGKEIKFGGVQLDVVLNKDNDNIIDYIDIIHDEEDDGLSKDEINSKYNQSQLFLDTSEIVSIIETRT